MGALHPAAMTRRLLFLAPFLVACAGPSPAPTSGRPPSPAVTSPSPAPTTSPATAASTDATVTPPPSPAPAPTVPTKAHLTWERSLEQPGLSISVGKRRVAVLTGEVPGRPVSTFMRDARVWRELPLGNLVPGEEATDHLRIYFGRDDRPRVMGYRQQGETQSQRYYRWKGNWRGKPGEIGRLDADPPAALFGILGHDDPEVVCKMGDICIIKRLTGWTMVPVPERMHAVEIAAKSAFAVAEGSALRIDPKDKAWKKLSETVPWTAEPIALWPFADGTLWVTDGEKLFHFEAGKWSTTPSPLEAPRKLWGRAPDDLFLAAQGGLAHFDGTAWHRLEAPKGALRDVNGNADEVWVTGPGGVWVGR